LAFGLFDILVGSLLTLPTLFSRLAYRHVEIVVDVEPLQNIPLPDQFFVPGQRNVVQEEMLRKSVLGLCWRKAHVKEVHNFTTLGLAILSFH